MKTKMFLFVWAISLLSVFTGCGDDKDSEEDGLAGTTWSLDAGEAWASVSFTKKAFTLELYVERTSYEVSGTYTYDPPYIEMDAEGETITGIVNGTKMTLTLDGESLTFTKKE
jgi:hypothetical protein